MLKIIKTTETQLVELRPENIESGAWISLIRPTADELNEVSGEVTDLSERLEEIINS